jgi:hypothetical protein
MPLTQVQGQMLSGSNNTTTTIQSNGTTAITIDSSQNVGIGTSSPVGKVDISGLNNTGGVTVLIRNTSDIGNTTPFIDLRFSQRSNGADNGRIRSGRDGIYSATASTMDSFMAFYTAIDNTDTERMRITSGGDVLIGRNSDLGAGARVNIESANNEADILAMRYFNAGAGKYWRHLIDSANGYLLVNNGGTGVTIADGGTSWSAYSDERLKTDLKPIENAVNKVTTLRAVTGRYKTDEEDKSRSFLIAQDVQKVLPEAVSTFKQVKSDDETEYLSLSYTETIPLLVAAIKEQQTMIEELKAEVAELKAKGQ